MVMDFDDQSVCTCSNTCSCNSGYVFPMTRAVTRIEQHRQVTRDRYDPTEVDRARDRQRGRVDGFSAETGAGLSSDKRDMYAARIEQRAVLPRPWAQAVAQELGGLATQASQAPGMVSSRSSPQSSSAQAACIISVTP